MEIGLGKKATTSEETHYSLTGRETRQINDWLRLSHPALGQMLLGLGDQSPAAARRGRATQALWLGGAGQLGQGERGS